MLWAPSEDSNHFRLYYGSLYIGRCLGQGLERIQSRVRRDEGIVNGISGMSKLKKNELDSGGLICLIHCYIFMAHRRYSVNISWMNKWAL